MTITATAARRILRRQGMPRQEIRAVLAADDPLVVWRLLELHGERLGEWLDEQRTLVASIERFLGTGRGADGTGQRGGGPFAVSARRTVIDENQRQRYVAQRFR